MWEKCGISMQDLSIFFWDAKVENFVIFLIFDLRNNFWNLPFWSIANRGALGSVKISGRDGSGRDEIFQPELFESSENMKKTRLDIRMTRPTLPDSSNPGFQPDPNVPQT